jgi:SOS-response transcriptional repressor LexA
MSKIDVHQTRLSNLRRLIETMGGPTALSQKLKYANGSYLAQLAGPKPTRTIGEKVARNIETSLGIPTNWLDEPNASLNFVRKPPELAAVPDRAVPMLPPASEFKFAHALEKGPINLPVFGAFKGGFDGAEINYQDPIETIARPAQLVGVRDACAVYVVNDSMEPRYFHGEKCLVHPGKPVRAGDFVAVELTNGHGMIKRLLRKNDDFCEFAQLNPPEKKRIPTKDIAGIHKIIGTLTD